MDTFSALKTQLKEQKLSMLYVFHGEETYLRDYYLGKLQEQAVPSGTETFNLTRLDGKEFTWDRFNDAVTSAPFCAERRLVVVRDVDIYKTDAVTKPLLEKLLLDGWEGCVVVFVYDTIEYKPDARTKIHKLLVDRGLVVEFAPQSATDLVPWVKRRFAALHKQIDTQTAQYLLFVCGSLMTTLSQEIEKIAAFSSVDTIQQRHIDAVAAPTMEAVVFDLTDAISARDYHKAIDLLHRLLDLREEPVMLLGALGKQLRGIYLARLAQDTGQGRQIVMQSMGYRSAFPADKLLQAARRVPLAWCRMATARCAFADRQLKSWVFKVAVLEQLLIVLAVS